MSFMSDLIIDYISDNEDFLFENWMRSKSASDLWEQIKEAILADKKLNEAFYDYATEKAAQGVVDRAADQADALRDREKEGGL